MQDKKAQRDKTHKRAIRRKQLMIQRCIGLGLVIGTLTGTLVGTLVGAWVSCAVVYSSTSPIESECTESTEPVESSTTFTEPIESINTSTESTESTTTPPRLVSEEKTESTPPPPEETDIPICSVGDPDNNVYPYSLMGTDWETEIYEQGWRYYEIPSAYKLTGGMFPEVAQVYLWGICQDAGVDYYMVLALIERESGYRYDATGDNGNSKGLMQIYEKFNIDRMEKVGATDLYNPYDNMRVGVDFLAEIQNRYADSNEAHCVLMVYNMGASGANNLWEDGIYSTAYSRQILQRAEDIRQELQEQ